MDYRECGAVRLALSEASVRELRQIAETAGITGLPVEFLTDAQLRELYPVLTRTESVKAALWTPSDGYLQPNSLVTAYVGAARDLGVTVATNAAVTGIGVRGGVVDSVSTEAGTFRTEQVIIAAGPWSAALARLAGLELPIVPVLHEYFVTEPVPGWHAGHDGVRADGAVGDAGGPELEHLGEQVIQQSVGDLLGAQAGERPPGRRTGDHHGVTAGAQGRRGEDLGDAGAGPRGELGDRRLMLDLLDPGQGQRCTRMAVEDKAPCLGEQLGIGGVTTVEGDAQRLAVAHLSGIAGGTPRLMRHGHHRYRPQANGAQQGPDLLVRREP
jgi:hypothetical protein